MVDLLEYSIIEFHAKEGRPAHRLDYQENKHSRSDLLVTFNATENKYAEDKGEQTEEERDDSNQKH